MPSSITHYLFALDALSDSSIQKDVFFLGAQGPDTFFYYGYHPFIKKNKKIISSFGTKLHDINLAKAYSFMVKYADENPLHKNMILSYVKGLFCHYVLDRATHPYIFYVTLFDNFQNNGKEYGRMHAYFETFVDVLYRQKYSYAGSTFQMIKCQKEDLLVLSRMFSALTKEMFPNYPLEDDSFYKAYKSFAFGLKTLYSKNGVKKSFFDSFMKKSLGNAMSHPKRVPDDIIKLDILNEQHRSWKNPVTGEKSSLSFEELTRIAERDFKEVVSSIGNSDFNEFLEKFVRNTDHRGCPVDGELNYHRYIFKNIVL